MGITLHEFFVWWENHSGLANALTGIGFALTAATPAVTTLQWSKRRFRRKYIDLQGEILDLKKDREHRDATLEKLRLEKNALQARCDELVERLPETALARAEKELLQGNQGKANRIRLNWLESEGEPISKLLFQRAQWAAAHAVGESRAIALVAGEAYATAGLALWPMHDAARHLLSDLQSLREKEAQGPIPFALALTELDSHTIDVFQADLVELANAGAREAKQQYDKGRYHIAVSLIERAVHIWTGQTGSSSAQTLRARRLNGYILMALGRSDEALKIAQDVARAQAENTALGPAHRDTQTSLYLVAQILDVVGRSDEALAIAQDTARTWEESPSLGPAHPDTLASRYLVAQILNKIGRSEEALKLVQDVAGAQAESPSLGPTHPHSLFSRSLVAQILVNVGRSEEALEVAQDVVRISEHSPSLGPAHPHTLASQYLVAETLDKVGRSEEALAIAQYVARTREESPSLGPAHPDTLASRYLVARILNKMGGSDEALKVAQDVARAQAESPSLGPAHRDTLNSRYLVAGILADVGRSDEALKVAQDVARISEDSSALGPTHPDTLASQYLVAQIRNRLRRKDEVSLREAEN